MLMTLTASSPIVTNTTTINPRLLRPMAIKRCFLALNDERIFKEGFVEVGEVQPVLVYIGEALGLVP
jgi:hypothetical protein